MRVNPIVFLAAMMMIIAGMVYCQPVTGQVSPSATQPLQANVTETVAITAQWAGGEDNSTINLGDLPADNMEKSWPGGSSGEEVSTYSNVAIDLYVRAAGDLANGTNTIPLDLLKYADYGASVSKASFTTSYVQVRSDWGPPAQFGSLTVPVDLFLTVPFATPPGLYTTTIYHAAVQAGGTAPTTP